MPTFVALTLSSFSYEMDMSIRLDIFLLPIGSYSIGCRKVSSAAA